MFFESCTPKPKNSKAARLPRQKWEISGGHKTEATAPEEPKKPIPEASKNGIEPWK